MLADTLGVPAEIFTIVGGLTVVGGIVLSRSKKFRDGRKEAATITGLVAGTPAVIVNGVVVELAKPGLAVRQDNVEQTLTVVVRRLNSIDRRLTPNGLNTNNPGDVMARTEKMLGKVIDHLGIDVDGE